MPIDKKREKKERVFNALIFIEGDGEIRYKKIYRRNQCNVQKIRILMLKYTEMEMFSLLLTLLGDIHEL